MNTNTNQEYRAKQLKHNKKYALDFLALNADKPDARPIILRFLEHIDEQGISAEKVKLSGAQDYIKEHDRKVNATYRLAFIDFFTTLTKTIEISIEITKLENFLRDEEKKNTDKRIAQVLSVDEVIKIQKTLKEKGKYQWLFTFEMFYIHGLKLEEIEQLGQDNFSQEQGVFTFKSEAGDEHLALDKTLTDLIKKHPKLLKPRKYRAYQDHIKHIIEKVMLPNRDKIIWSDVMATREKYFPTCAICKLQYPNTGEFWALIQYEGDTYQKKWFCCINCAEKEYEKGKE